MQPIAPQLSATVGTFAQRMPSTRRGARLARLFAAAQFRAWGVSPSVAERAEHVVAELASNAALHGRLPGRDFQLALTLDSPCGTLRIAVSDARPERLPTPSSAPETGHGLLIVAALADRWGADLSVPPLKTVWAELDHPLP